MNVPSPSLGRTREALASLLVHVVAEESELAATTRAYAWRVRGSPVQSIKRLFTEQGRQIEWWVGEIGRRAAAIGVALKPSAKATESAAAPDSPSSTAITAIVARHEAVAGELHAVVDELRERDPHGDAVMLLEGLLEFHETSAWMLRLLLESPERRRMG